MAENAQKLKLLRLMDILRQGTDERHPMTTAAILKELADAGIGCDRRTLSRDIALLNEEVAEIMCVTVGHEKAYYIEDRPFSMPELGILIDAVRAAEFIPQGKTDELIGRLAALSGRHGREQLLRVTAGFSAPKHTNGNIYYSIGALQEAIALGQAAEFLYFDLDETRRRTYRYEGAPCLVEPLTLVLRGNRYYLIAYTEKHGGLTCYRIDRMENVRIADALLSDEARAAEKDVGGFIERSFHMFGGPQEEVELVFDRDALGAVYDCFGEGIRVRRRAGGRFTARVPVVVSPVFYGWVAQFGGKIGIKSPMCVCDGYRAHIKKALEGTEGE